jgi:hypothetical protein
MNYVNLAHENNEFKFEQVLINTHLKIPYFSRTVVTNKNRIFLMGGVDPDI